MHGTLKYDVYASLEVFVILPESLETVNSGRFGNRSAIFLNNDSPMTSQLSLNVAIFQIVQLFCELQTRMRSAMCIVLKNRGILGLYKVVK